MACQTIRVRVRALESSLSGKERQLAKFLLANPHKASKMTIGQIAQALSMADGPATPGYHESLAYIPTSDKTAYGEWPIA